MIRADVTPEMVDIVSSRSMYPDYVRRMLMGSISEDNRQAFYKWLGEPSPAPVTAFNEIKTQLGEPVILPPVAVQAAPTYTPVVLPSNQTVDKGYLPEQVAPVEYTISKVKKVLPYVAGGIVAAIILKKWVL